MQQGQCRLSLNPLFLPVEKQSRGSQRAAATVPTLADALTSVIQPFAHGLGHVEGQPLALRLCPDHLAVDVPLCGGGEVFVS